MPHQRAWQHGDICYQTGLRWRSLIHLVRPTSGRNGHYLTSIKLNFKPDKIQIILKKMQKGTPMIAFAEADRFDEVLWVLALQLSSKRLKWRKDEWEMRRLAKKEDSA